MLITQDTRATEKIETPHGIMLGMDWLKSECERIKSRDSWRNPVIIKVGKGYVIEDESIKKIMSENKVSIIVPANCKKQVKKMHNGWSDSETDMLVSLYQAGYRISDIAKELSKKFGDRTVNSCYWKMSQLGIKLAYNTRKL